MDEISMSYLFSFPRYDIEISFIDTLLNKEHFKEKSCKKCAPRTSPRPLFNFGK